VAKLGYDNADAHAGTNPRCESDNERRSPSEPMKTRTYSVTAQIVTGMNGTTVWQGRLTAQATSQRQAIAEAKRQIIDTVVEFDERIDPRIRIVEVTRECPEEVEARKTI
jgi:hypothetical protein